MDSLAAFIQVDIKTLFVVLFWGNLTCMVLLCAYLFFVHVSRVRQLGWFLLLAKAFLVISYFMLVMRSSLPDLISVNIGNSFLFLGMYFESRAILTLCQDQKRWTVIYPNAVLGITLLAFNIAEYIHPDASLRVTVSSLCVFLILLLPTIRLMAVPRRSKFKRSIGAFYLFFVLMLLPRAAYPQLNLDTGIFANTWIQGVTILSLVALTFFSLAAYLLLMKEDTDNAVISMARTDYLTNLANRFGFLSNANLIFNRHRDHVMPIGLLYMDIDFFKEANDNYGHAFGDAVLKRFAEIIHKNSRANDLASRFGGDEFVMLLAGIQPDIPGKVARRILDEVRATSFEEMPGFNFTVSIGVSCGIPGDNEDLSTYIQRADRALYQAKQSGKNQVVEYGPGVNHYPE